MSQLFSTPEDPWSLPAPKQWEPSDGDPLQDNGPVSPVSPESGSAVAERNMEGSIWDESNGILSGGVDTTTGATTTTGTTTAPTISSSDFHSWSEAVRSTYTSTSPDLVSVSELAEREGLLFKHTNYLIEHQLPLEGEAEASGERRVIRRYSDFVWLVEVLLKRYTFRLVPEIPPKKLTSTSDPLFLERRRRGLARFLNALVRHPVLRSEPLVIMFLTVPTDLSSWRRQAQYDSSEEFVDRQRSTQFMHMWESSFEEFTKMMSDAEDELKAALENWNRISIVVERLCVRQKQAASDQERLGSLLSSFRDNTVSLYPVEESRVPQINEGLREAAKHVTTSVETLQEEATDGDEKVLEEFKRHYDYLYALRALFERYHRLGGNQIEPLNKRKEHNEQKLAELQGKPDVKGTEIDRLTDSIRADIKEIARQTNRDWLIKENVLTEFVMFQETQFQITRVLQHWARDRLEFTERHMDNWTGLSSALQDIPTNRTG